MTFRYFLMLTAFFLRSTKADLLFPIKSINGVFTFPIKFITEGDRVW